MKTHCVFLLLETSKMSCRGNKSLKDYTFKKKNLDFHFRRRFSFKVTIQILFFGISWCSISVFLFDMFCLLLSPSNATLFVFWSLFPTYEKNVCLCVYNGSELSFNLCYFLNIEKTVEEVEMENVVPMRSLLTRHYACRWPSPSWSCLWADGASTGTGPVQEKDSSPLQFWWGRGGREHIPTGFSEAKNYHCVSASPLLASMLLQQLHPKSIRYFHTFLTPLKWKLTFLHFREKLRKHPAQKNVQNYILLHNFQWSADLCPMVAVKACIQNISPENTLRLRYG